HTKALRNLDYDLFLVDYRGFGKSEGALSSESDLTIDFQAVYDHLLKSYEEDQIILVGYSLGSGPVSYLAANNSPQGVVLVAPYTSLTDMKNEFFWMFPDFLMKYDMNNLGRLAQSTSPVYIIHGKADQLIPITMSQTIEALDPDRIRLLELEDTSHRGAILHRRFGQVVRWAIDGVKPKI
ncbi:MAG: alpha/beta fold hydrolase, partial [Bacteroidota bacterium]